MLFPKLFLMVVIILAFACHLARGPDQALSADAQTTTQSSISSQDAGDVSSGLIIGKLHGVFYPDTGIENSKRKYPDGFYFEKN